MFMKTNGIDRPDQDDCNCGKTIRITDPKKKSVAKKTIKKRSLLK